MKILIKEWFLLLNMKKENNCFSTLDNFANELKDIEEEIKKLENQVSDAKKEKVESETKSEELLKEIEAKRILRSKDNLELEGYKFKVKELEKEEKRLIIEIKNIETDIVKEENKLNGTKEK